ncbi:MAG: M1 family metallopeptidase [Planctomycetes bacterium]|nr:M1 family metallopeptidase [Planctomycetota bacterium]
MRFAQALLLRVVGLIALPVTARAATPEVPYVHDAPRFELRLPSSAWQRRDVLAEGVVAVVLAPVADLTTRCSVLRMDTRHLPDGIATRARQLAAAAGAGFRDDGIREEPLDGRTAQRWDYALHGQPVAEWLFADAGKWVLFQLAAPTEAWNDPIRRAELDAIRASFRWTGGADPVPAQVSATAPEAIRARRAEALAAVATDCAVESHRIEVRVEPAAGTLDVLDELELVATADAVAKVELYTSVVNVDEVTCDAPHRWSTRKLPQVDVLELQFDPPLARGRRLTVLVHAAADDFFLAQDQQLVAEIAVFGQVRPRSSWSSHVVWYPIDGRNDAAVDITFDVPAPYVAVTGGDLVVEREEGGRRIRRYVEASRHPRLLPFGFAVGEYVSQATRSPGGLALEVFGFAGEEQRIAQRIEFLAKAAAAFEPAFGPLPWAEVRFCHVQPERKETGVSLPGLILVSDAYFPDLEGIDASDGDLTRPDVLGLLVIADELAHQWNIYATGFPNELGEGLSTYSNALFVEALHGYDAYLRVIAGCQDGWIDAAGAMTEFAVADPAIYSNARYRSVVFCKTPLVLHALREQLGDARFFAGLAAAFGERDRAVDGFERFARGFARGAGADVAAFFERWFFRAGFPQLQVTQRPMAGGASLRVVQVQPEAPYELILPLEFRGEDGRTHRTCVLVNEREQRFDVPVPFRPLGVTADPDGVAPARIDG